MKRPAREPAAPRSPWAGALVIVILTLIAYVPAIQGGFIWDDDDYVTENRLLHDFDGLRRIWHPGETHQYYPVVFTSFWIEHQLWGGDPFGFHLVNVLLHSVNALLVWRVMRRLGLPGAWLIAAVFALHPVHVESVAWITERKNVLSGCFYLLAGLSFLRFADEVQSADVSGRARWGRYALTLLLFAAALLSKSVTCSLPAALVLVMLYQRTPLIARRLLPLVPMLALGLAAALHTAHLERTQVGAVGAAFDTTFIERALVAARALLFYPTKVLVPWPVMFIYPRWSIDVGTAAAYAPAALVAAGSVAAIVAFARGRRGPFVALAFYAGTIFPALGFVNVYPHRFSFVADHFQYLASLGIIALVVAPLTRWADGALCALPRKEPEGPLPRLFGAPRAAAVLAVVLLPPLFVLTWLQAATYQDAETVWRDTLSKNDDAWMPHNNLASILLSQAELDLAEGNVPRALRRAAEAREHAARAVALKPDHHPAHSNLSEALRLQGEFDDALAHAQTATDLVLAEVDRAGATAPLFLARYHYQRGRLLQVSGRPAAAADAYRASLAIHPSVDPRLDLARTLVGLDRLDEAVAEYEQVLVDDPESFAALGTLAAIAARREAFADADRYYRRAVNAATRPPEQIQILTRFINFQATCPDPAYRDLEEATLLAEGLISMTGGRDPGAYAVLASVHAEAGRLEAAVQTAEQALALARQTAMRGVAQQIQERLDDYRRQLEETNEPD